MTRAEALVQLQQASYDALAIEKDKQYVVKKLGITDAELKDIIHSPPKTYKDYPNNEQWLSFLYNVYTKFLK